jgi:hypothetical protein
VKARALAAVAAALLLLVAAAPSAAAQEPPPVDLGWLLRGSGTLTCALQVNHLVCHAVAPDIQPPQIAAFGAIEPWLPPGDCQNFTFRPGDNAGRPAEVTVYGKGFGYRGCVPGVAQSTDRGFCLLTIAVDGRQVCDYGGGNLTHLDGVTMAAVDVFGQPQFGWSWGTRFFIP